MSTTKRARELADELLRPLGIRSDHLTETSRRDLERQMETVIERKAENTLYDSQKGWERDKDHDRQDRRTR